MSSPDDVEGGAVDTFADVADVVSRFADHGYLADQRLATTVFLQSRLSKPVLLEGPDGREPVEARIIVDATGRQARIARRLGAERVVADRLVGLVCHLDLPDGPLDATVTARLYDFGVISIALRVAVTDLSWAVFSQRLNAMDRAVGLAPATVRRPWTRAKKE